MPEPPRLLDRVRHTCRLRRSSPRTERAYLGWIKRYIFFHEKRHPQEMGEVEIRQFLVHLAVELKVAASTQNQAFCALLFLYREVLGKPLQGLEDTPRASRAPRVPVVLTEDEVGAILSRMHGVPALMASLMYGAGLRLLECCRLRVKDIDFARREITVRDGKGCRDRVTILPDAAIEPLQRHLDRVRHQHQCDLRFSAGYVDLPGRLGRKCPAAYRQWPWQWVFPATRVHLDRPPASVAAITFTRPSSRESSRWPSERRTSPSGPHRTP